MKKKSETPERQSRFNANGVSIKSFPVGKKNTINSNNKYQNVFDDTAYATSGDTTRRRSNSRSSKTRRTSLSPNSRRYHKSKMYKGHKMSPTRWMRKFKTKNERSSQISHSKQGSKMNNNNSNDDNSIITPTNAIVGVEFDDIYSQSNIDNLDDFDDDESICTHSTTEYDPSSRRLTTIVWKRKSGFTSLIKSGYVRASEKANTLGHSTVTNLQKLIKVSHQNNDVSSSTQYEPPSNIKMWERRRIVLEGGILMYFHEDADVNTFDEDESPTNNNDDDGLEKENSNFTASHSDIFFTKHRNLSKFKNKLIEFSHAATHNAIFSLHPNESNEHYKALYKSAINTPRGLIDLVATRAAASVTHYGPSSFAPTPYSLSIILNQTNKWEICFQTSKELLTWLGALTDISLKHSIDSFRYDHGYSYCSAEYDVTPSGSFHDSVSKSGETSFDNDEFIDDNGERDVRLEVSNTHQGRNLFSNSGVVLPSIWSTKKKVVRFDSKGIATGSSLGSYTKMAIVNGAMLIFSILWTDTIISTYSILVAQTFINGIAWYYVYTSYRKRVSFVDKRGSEHTETEKEIGLETTQAIQSSIMTTPNQQLNQGGSFRNDVSFSMDKPSFLDEKPFYMPQAGESTLKLKDITDAKNIKDRPVGWISALSSSIQLRGAGYLFNKKKIPSSSSLYELIQVDAFDSDVHMLDVGRRFQLPEVHFKSQHGNWRAPNLLVISFALPTSAPKLGKASDGKGYIVVGYYRMRNETRKVLEIISNHKYNTDDQNTKLMQLFPNECDRQIINGVKLWEKWCQCAPSDQEMQKRLKFIPRGDNLKEIGVPSWICKYNGKPMLIKRPGETNFVYSHPDQNMMEIDINMHPLPYMFRQAMTYLKDYYFQQMIMTFAFVIEGRDEDELPEVLLGNPLQLPFVDPKNVITSESVFRSK